MKLLTVFLTRLIDSLPKGVRVQIAAILIISLILLTIYLQAVKPAPLSEEGGLTLGADTASLFIVVDVVDGDTIKVEQNGEKYTVRLIGIDSPEITAGKTPECFAKEATNALSARILNKMVFLFSDGSQDDKDRYGRLLRYVFLDDENINGYMIEKGFAREYKYAKEYEYYDDFVAKEQAAKITYSGLWSPTACFTN